MRKTLCCLAVGTLTLLSQGLAAAQITADGDLIDAKAEGIPIPGALAPSDKPVIPAGDTSPTKGDSKPSAPTAGGDSPKDKRRDSTKVDDATTKRSQQKTPAAPAANTTVVQPAARQASRPPRFSDIPPVPSGDDTVVRDRFDSNDVALLSRDGTVGFVDRSSTVAVTKAEGPQVLPVRQAGPEPTLPAPFVTPKPVPFPRNFVTGRRSPGSGGDLAATSQDYSLLVLASLALLAAGYVVSRLARRDPRPATALAAPAGTTPVVPDWEAPETLPEPAAWAEAEAGPDTQAWVEAEAGPEPEAGVEDEPAPEPQVQAEDAEPPRPDVRPAADTALEDEIATLRRQLAAIDSNPSGSALAGV